MPAFAYAPIPDKPHVRLAGERLSEEPKSGEFVSPDDDERLYFRQISQIKTDLLSRPELFVRASPRPSSTAA